MPQNDTRRAEKLPTLKALKAWVYLHLQRYDEALDTLAVSNEEGKDKFTHKELREQIEKAKVDHSIQEKALYRKMLHSK